MADVPVVNNTLMDPKTHMEIEVNQHTSNHGVVIPANFGNVVKLPFALVEQLAELLTEMVEMHYDV